MKKNAFLISELRVCVCEIICIWRHSEYHTSPNGEAETVDGWIMKSTSTDENGTTYLLPIKSNFFSSPIKLNGMLRNTRISLLWHLEYSCCQTVIFDIWWCEWWRFTSLRIGPSNNSHQSILQSKCECVRCTMDNGRWRTDYQFLTWTKAIDAVGHQITHSINEKIYTGHCISSYQIRHRCDANQLQFWRKLHSVLNAAKCMKWRCSVCCALNVHTLANCFRCRVPPSPSPKPRNNGDDSLESKLWFRSGNTMAVLFVVPSGGNVGDKRR